MNYDELNKKRKRLRLTQQQHAQLLGVSRSTYRGWNGTDKRRAPGVPLWVQRTLEAHTALGLIGTQRLIRKLHRRGEIEGPLTSKPPED